MLDGLRQFIADIVSPDAQPRAFDEADYRLAATALLIHVVSLDGEPSAVELYHFTSGLMREVNEQGRLRIVEMMWEMVFADGKVTEFEDNVLWRAADLLGISGRDRIELKHRVAEQQTARVTGGADSAAT